MSPPSDLNGQFFYVFIYLFICDRHCTYHNVVHASNFVCTLSRLSTMRSIQLVCKIMKMSTIISANYVSGIDLPIILSGNRLAYLDPHEEIWKKETGQWYDIDSSTCMRYSDTFSPFDNLCGFSIHTGTFAGTLFRFPLRNVRREKGVSSHLYDIIKLRALLSALREEAKCILLFLRSVRTVKVFEIAQNGAHSSILEVSICETSRDQLRQKRLQFQKNLRRLFERQSYGITQQLDEVVRVQVNVKDYQNSRNNSQSQWLVGNRVGSQIEEVRKVAKELKVFPWVGVALETSLTQVEHGGGRVFCVLPMPIEVSCELPVHVNGTFSLNDERRELKWRGTERRNDQSAHWNHLLVEKLLPPCYASLLLEHAKMLLEPQQFYGAWPNTNKVRGTHWEGLLTPLLSTLFSESVISFSKPGGLGIPLWIKVSSATFVPGGTSLPTQVTTALVACGVKLVTVTEAIWNALKHCGILVTSVSPSLTRAELKRSPRSYSSFSSYDKLELLRYCLSDNVYGDMQNLGRDMQGLALLPLANGTFTTLEDQYFMNSVYLCTGQCPRYLLPSLEGELVDNGIEREIYMKLKAIADGGYTNLKVLTVNTVASLLPRAMPQEWQYQNCVSLSHLTFNMAWFERFWRWVPGGNLSLFSNQLLVPVFDSQTGTHSIMQLSQTSPSLFIPTTIHCSDNLITALGKLGVKCCQQKQYQFVQHVSYLSSLMNYYSANGIVDAITHASPSYSNISLRGEEANCLQTAVHGFTVTYQRVATLKSIPMFRTLCNTNKRLYSVTQVERSRSAQMEPLSFPLSAENLPSSVILFSSSDYYQRELLQSLSVYCASTVDLLTTVLFPLIEVGSMGRNSSKKFMKEVLENFDAITSNTNYQTRETFKSSIASLPFLPTSVGRPKAPNILFSPDPELKILYYNEPVFPLQPFSSGRCLSVLIRSCGLKVKVTPQEVVDIVNSISSPASTFPVKVDQVKHTRARAILSYISKWGDHQLSQSVSIKVGRYHRNMQFLDALKELSLNNSWLPVQCSPPTNYPTWLSWKGSGNTCHLVSFGSSVLLSQNQATYSLACGSQAFFVEHSLQAALCNIFSPSPHQVVQHVMAHLEEVILRHSQCHNFEEVRHITHIIYRLLHKYEKQGYSVDLTMLQDTEECVWISKHRKFIRPHSIALEQNTSFRQNLEPFVYTLPGDLDEFASLFKALGVKDAVTKPQILGILETIKDGTSASLGVSNNQAWQLVMNILNWLTGSGEHECDSDSVFVPVEPDTEWPTLVMGDKVVYTDSTFLQRFLESSDSGEDNYTFVNHRVSPQLAHQLRLTPLSKYLKISEDAFEDVGQSEPLTVRLKNILKDYKDGLTIIKEMLQNADDAGASEMNICYDTRYHTEKRESLFFPGMAECHGPALVVNNNAMFTKEDFVNITKLAGATKEGKALKIGKFGVGFCSVYHITDIPSFVSDNLLYIFDPTLTYLKDEIKNPARPGKKVCFTSSFISRSKQLAPYVGLFGFDPESCYKGTTFRFPFRTAGSELSGKIYTKDDVTQLMQQIQMCSSKLLLFLRNIKSLTFSQNDHGQVSCRELINITKTTQSIGSRSIHQVSCSLSGSPSTTEYWLMETSTDTILEKYSTASVACSLHPLPESGELYYTPQQIEGEMFCFLPLSIKTGLPVHVSSNFAVSNNRRGIWTSDETSGMSEEVEWNQSLMKGVISSAYCELLEELKKMQTDSRVKSYEFFSMWPLQADLKVCNPWHLGVEVIYESIATHKLFFSVSTHRWLTMEESKFLDSDILKVSYSSSIPSAVLDIVNHLQLPVVHLPAKYQKHLDLSVSIVTEEKFLEHFFSNIDELHAIVESRNTVLCLALECYANELDRHEDRFCYLQNYLKANACIPCEPDGDLLRMPDELIHPHAHFAELYDVDEEVFPLMKFCDKKLVEEAMKDLGMLHKSIPLCKLEERATGIAALYNSDPTKAMKRVKLIIECLLKEDQCERLSLESCTAIAGIPFLPVLPKPDDYPLPWKGDNQKLCAGNDALLKGMFHYSGDNTNMNIAGSQVILLNEDLPGNGGCGIISHRMQAILQIKTTPSYTEVIAHFTILIDVFESSPEMVIWADRMSRKVYEFLDTLLKQDSESEMTETFHTCISHLLKKSCIWTGKGFVGCRYVAQKWSLNGPYLYRVPESLTTRKYLQKALKIKDSFSIEDLVSVLQTLKTDFGTTPLPDNCQALVKAILPELPSQVQEKKSGPIMLPDSEFIMDEATNLFFNDMCWKAHDKDYRFVHDRVPMATAIALGVQLCRTASLSRYSVPGSQFKVMEFGAHEELTRRIQNIIHDYPFDVTILKELLQNADDAKATKMHVILDMRTHSDEHLLSEEWRDLQGPALLVWNDREFSEQDLEGIQRLGLGSKRSDSETIGQYGIGFNAVYHLTDCPSFLTGGDTLCILDPHMRYVPQATDRYPGAMYGNLDDKFWSTFDGIKSTYLRDDLANRPKELLSGSLFRFPLRHSLKLAQTSEIVKDLPGEVNNRVISSSKMNGLLKDWAPQMKQSLLFLNNVRELKFFVIKDKRGVLNLINSYRTELTEASLNSRSDLVQKIKEFSLTKEPYIATYALTIVESLMKREREESEEKEEWLIQQGIGDVQKKVETWSYVEQVKPRHGIAAPLKREKVRLVGQVFCFLPLPLYSGLPVHINGHFILNSNRRNLWASTDHKREDDKSYWNQNILQAIASSYAHFLERITNYFAHVEGTGQATLERHTRDYYMSFPGSTYREAGSSERTPLSEPWLKLVKNVFEIMVERNSPVLAIPTASSASLRQGEDNYWQPLKNEEHPQSQVYFCKAKEYKELRSILERIGMKITCAPLWIMNHFKIAKCEIPLVSRSSVFSFYKAFYKHVISDHFPCAIEHTPFISIGDFKLFTEFLLEKETDVESPQNIFPEEPFDYPLLLTVDNQLRIFDKANKVLCSEYANLFPQCPDKFLHKELRGLAYCHSYFVSVSDNETVRVTIVKELLESILPSELKNMYVFPGNKAMKNVDIKMLWQCFKHEVFESILCEVLKIWALLLTTRNQLFRHVSDKQLLPIIPLSASIPPPSSTDIQVSTVVECVLNAPFLDTHVVPVETVLPFCPQFSDPKRMLKNLYYLNQEFPFTKNFTTQDTGVLVQYFARIHLKKEMNCCQMIKSLPLFETIDGTVVPIEGKRVYIWPGNICQEGNENWLRGTDLVFLKPFAAWSKLGVSDELGVCIISAEDTYVQFIFPNFFKLSKYQRHIHLRHIRDYLFDANFVNQEISISANQFISALQDLPCIGDDGTSLQVISSFCTHKKKIFTTFPKHFKILPKDILQGEEQKWMTFFLKLGLKKSVTQEKYLALCNDVANGKLKAKTRTASRVLLDYLFSQGEARHHGFHKDQNFLGKVSQIEFVCPVPVPELKWIHPVPKTSNHIVLADEQICLCTLSGSCLTQSKELIWTVLPIISVAKDDPSLLDGLGIKIQPSGDDVIKNIKNLSQSCFAVEQLLMKYTAPHCTNDQLSLMDVFSSMLTFLQKIQCQVNVTELERIPCIPVYAKPNQYPVLVEPFRVVYMDKEDTEPFYPFIHSVPHEIYASKELLTALGVKGSLQLRHMQIVLESLYTSSDGLELEPNSVEIVKFAIKELNSLLTKNKENRKQSMGEDAIAEALRPLYLSGIDGRMHHVDSLVSSHMKSVDLYGTNLYQLFIPRTWDIDSKNFCKLLPADLRPKPLMELCSRKVSETVELCEPTDCVTSITDILKIPALPVGMCTVVRYVTKSKEGVSEAFEKHLHNFLQTLKICCVEYLAIDIILNKDDICKVIATEPRKCFMQEQESSYFLYLDSNVTAMHISDIRECIVETLVSCLKDTLLHVEEVECQQILKFLEYLLRANSSEDVYNYLTAHDMHAGELDHVMDLDIWNLKLGSSIPRSWHFLRLDANNNNIFRSQEYVGYEILDGEYIVAMVLHPMELTDSAGQLLKPMHMKYKIIIRNDDEEGKVVKAIELSKFTMGKKTSEPDDATSAISECSEMVPFEGDSEDSSGTQSIPQNLQQAEEEIRNELQDIWQLPESDRKRAIRRLYLKWHPDKNQDNVGVTEEAFKFLMKELDRLEKDESESFTGVHSWRTYQDSWNSYAREQRHYSERYTSQNTSSQQQGSNDGGGSGSGGGGRRGGGGFCFTPPRNVREAQRWVRQAEADLEALEALLNSAQQNYRLSAHVCFMAHEVAEKALKGGMYATCGLRDEFLKFHKLTPLTCSLMAEKPDIASGLGDLTSPLEPYYLETRFPNQCPSLTTPSEYYTLDQAEKAAKCARGVLRIVKDIVQYEF